MRLVRKWIKAAVGGNLNGVFTDDRPCHDKYEMTVLSNVLDMHRTIGKMRKNYTKCGRPNSDHERKHT